ncbi:neural cell adhesion molecule fasciclin 2 isoform X2 [Megachile rotundata]|uniref:neural cell adhesion molecule fasciclin 2 isoform X2 n=1 Tax=Megachile rotundata TaxID=143995 RepID=UPI000614B1C3|nr:PREDICTED: fasciclin-2 isoform X2 [Megachile rotundata]XP_012143795.1 PREDICTED: fasciclin-2 isoform X1 [Megachile rotundata]
MSAAETSICISVLCVYVFRGTPPPRDTDPAAYAKQASLEILPSGDTQTKPVGSSIILTCKSNVDDIKLIKDMQWLDPQNRTIESLNTFSGHTKPPMYTEFHQDKSLSLFFNSLQEEQAGKYRCKANYADTIDLQKSVTIETIVAITWDNAPLNQYPILGDDFAIQCKVRARPSPSVDWLYNGELIKTNERYIIEPYALKIKNVQESDDGTYTCRASVLTTGELKERAIRVEVHVRPTVEELSSPNIIEGEDASIQCRAHGKPPPKFTWVKSLTQQNLSTAERFTVDADTGVLTIKNVNREDAGEYQCTATNAAGTANTNIKVNVIVKPKIMEFLNSTVVQDKEASLICKAFGRPPPQVTFRKHTSEKPYSKGAQLDDDRIVLTNSADDITGETVGTLTIRESLRSNDGLYECIAQNAGGEARRNGHLTVEFPPSFASMPNATVWSWEQRQVNISCIAESIPNATIRWTVHGDQKIDNDNMIKQLGNGPYSTLMIVPLDKRYYTTYKCIASNAHGTREHNIELREATKPGEILQAKMVEITATTIKFELVLPPTQPELPLRTITVQYKESSQTWMEAKNKTWSVNSMYVLEDLKPQTSYEFRFAARNVVGLGNWGGYHSQMTPVRTFPNEPKIITAGSEYDVSMYNNQYELRWTKPADNGEPIDMYQIKYCQIQRVASEWETLEETCRTEDLRSAGRVSHWVKNLYSDKFYVVELKAHNAMGFSKAGSAKFKTARGIDTTVVHHQAPLISSAAIIGIVIAVLFVIIIIIDVICCCAHKTGIIYYVCERSRRKPVDEEDAKLGSLYGWRFPLPYCDQKMANVAGVTAIQDSGSGKSTIRLVRHTAIDEKEPLKEEKKITPIIDSGLRRESSITFDGKRSVSKTGFVGKDSAV